MQLAYVSTGSFISPGGRSLSGAFPGQRDGAEECKAGRRERPIAAAMPEEEGFRGMIMMCMIFGDIFFLKGCQKLKVNVFA